MRTYAAFCTMPLESHYNDTYGIFTREACAEGKVYLRRMRVCFSSELSRLARSFPCCSFLLRQQTETVLIDIVSSLCDIDTLMAFPSSNIKEVVAAEGNDLRNDALSKLSSCKIVKRTSIQNADEEASFVKRNNQDQGAYLDEVGSNYNSQHLWSHCNQVAVLLCENQSMSHEQASRDRHADYSGIGKVLCEVLSEINNGRLLERTPRVSCERECFKRFIVLYTLLMKLDKASHGLIINSILNSILENMLPLSEIALYHEKDRARGCKDKQSRLKRGTAVAFQKAYLTFSGSLLTILLRDNLKLGNDQSLFIRQLVLSVFVNKEDIRDIIEGAHKKPFLQFQLLKTVTTTTDSEKNFLRNMSSDLALTFLSRIDDLLIHDIQCNSKGFLHFIMTNDNPLHEADVTKAFSVIVNELLLNPLSKMTRAPIWKSELQMAINHQIHRTEAFRTNASHCNASLVTYRESVLSSFLCESNANNTSSSRRKAKLQLLTRILQTFSSEDIGAEEKVYSSDRNLASFMAYAKIARSLKVSFESNSADSNTVDEIKTCANALLSLPVSTGSGQDTVPLLQYAASCPASNKEAAYIVEFSVCLNRDFSTNQSLNEMERELFPQKAAMNNPYARN